jgi:hypothetical protein
MLGMRVSAADADCAAIHIICSLSAWEAPLAQRTQPSKHAINSCLDSQSLLHGAAEQHIALTAV